MKTTVWIAGCVMMLVMMTTTATAYEKDVIATSGGDLEITFIGHGTLMFTWSGQVIHVDPFSRLGDFDEFPDADLILITHAHGDHLDEKALAAVRKPSTRVIVAPVCEGRVTGAEVLKSGESVAVSGVKVEAIPAYNLVHMRSEGQPFHPKGEGIGCVLAFGDTRVYVAGDTENTPEMKALENIDVAFLPMNLPYTMTPEMVADAARAFKPDILYPYHYGDTDPERLVELLADQEDIEVRVRPMK